ncbi:unnamed protein product (macronuclear) [Paramecium tetraurelia]|uniref:Enkurin domain-containing protein n=1 Tax=Paramecium tetraurelia TaxID=5888 RepID=A0C413_PARTE|nr:uncharacterized protein GSPATT00035010001 [Paramecium tetraurelia]CAK65530.1 unnamed protein product [Paramecium tetraurelia]|eukprot:XP_001432927.1 hypothetical protein (macronuclear) [Paramecium tetraurelia strain d4-2]
MDKEFVYNLENGNPYVSDFIHQKVKQINSRGINSDILAPQLQAICNSKPRKLDLKYRNSISYTPHQNKYFGYCQCPNQKVKLTSLGKVSINNNATDRKMDVKPSQPVNLTNCFNKPKTPKISFIPNVNSVRYQISENDFVDNLQPHLSGSLKDATQVYKSGSIEAMKYRKGTQLRDKLIKLNNNESDQLRFTCRYLNAKKIKSPPYMVMKKYEFIERINEEQEKKMAKSIDDSIIKRITPLPHLKTLVTKSYNSSYQNVDISLSQSIDSQKIKAFLSQR